MQKGILWLGLIGASIAALFWLFILFAGFIFERPTYEGETLGILLISSACILSTLVAWFRRKIGGWLLLISGLAFVAFSLVSAGTRQWFAALVSGFPFALAGTLILIASRPAPQAPID